MHTPILSFWNKLECSFRAYFIIFSRAGGNDKICYTENVCWHADGVEPVGDEERVQRVGEVVAVGHRRKPERHWNKIAISYLQPRTKPPLSEAGLLNKSSCLAPPLCVTKFIKKYISDMILKPYLHWQRLCDNAGDSDSHYVLALATLGEATQIGLFLFLVASTKVAKASTITCCQIH